MSPNPATILLASANTEAVKPLANALRADGQNAVVKITASAAVETLTLGEPDLAIVWLELPDTHGGFAMIRTIRDAVGSRIDPLTPLIAVDPSPSEFNCLCAFQHGCDDYVTSDCSTLQLRARIGALLRRSSGHVENARVDIGDLKIDSDARQVRVGDFELALSRKEFALLRELALQPNRVFTKAELLRLVWGYAPLHSRTLDTHVSRLRRKLRQAGAPEFVQNVWGVGYRLAETAAPSRAA